MGFYSRFLQFVLVILCSSLPFYHSLTTFQYAELVTFGFVGDPLDFVINFRTSRTIEADEQIGIILPRFTQRLSDYQSAPTNISFNDLLISPSTMFRGKWLEGFNVYGTSLPYPSPLLVLETIDESSILANSYISIKVFKENGIGVVCGFPESSRVNDNTSVVLPTKSFEMATVVPGIFHFNETVLLITTTYDYLGAVVSNTSQITNYTLSRNISLFNGDNYAFDKYTGIGNGCSQLNQCSGHGQCDYCYETCRCFSGWGSQDDLLMTGAAPAPDCSKRACPVGRAFGDIPTASDRAHALAECSNQGNCNRTTGQCMCFPPFAGSACERMDCPNSCSGHGQCISMAAMARLENIENPQRPQVIYGSGAAMHTTAWDHQSIYGCVCDSSWDVGFDQGQVQLAEFFGPDCSLKRCPSGDDPFTAINELECTGVSQVGGRTGRSGNICHIDCSNRGVCDYSTGTCRCFPGSWGKACDQIANAGDQ